ncbi:MAG: ribonuclease P protein component [Candidatus Kerfeldbacteria bacterium]|nr:ribonuclease P protein component [Candidatus Kerfeldbacteria bacterium]
MLTRANRLRHSTDFQRVYMRSRTAAGRRFILKYRPGASAKTRVGVVVGSKVSKLAVERNLLRRRIREIMRTQIDRLPSHFDLVVIAKPAAKNASFQEVEQEVSVLLRQTTARPTNSYPRRT